MLFLVAIDNTYKNKIPQGLRARLQDLHQGSLKDLHPQQQEQLLWLPRFFQDRLLPPLLVLEICWPRFPCFGFQYGSGAFQTMPDGHPRHYHLQLSLPERCPGHVKPSHPWLDPSQTKKTLLMKSSGILKWRFPFIGEGRKKGGTGVSGVCKRDNSTKSQQSRRKRYRSHIYIYT